MNTIARIGSTIHIRGEVTAREPLAIGGQIEGSIEVDGHPLTVEAGARIRAAISGHTLVIGGDVRGSLKAGSKIVVRETATIDGDLTAPAVSVSDGAKVRGKIETAPRGAATVVPMQRRDAAFSAA